MVGVICKTWSNHKEVLYLSTVPGRIDFRGEETVSEELELERLVRRATKLMQHQNQQDDEEGSSGEEVADSSMVVGVACSDNEQGSSKDTTKVTSTKVSSTAISTSQFSFRRRDYSSRPGQS